MGIGLVAGIGGIASIGGSLIGADTASDAAGQAADAQVKSAQIASDTQKDFFNQSKNALSPYMGVGDSAASTLGGSISNLSQGIPVPTMTQADLEATPGYQFTLNQGLKATQNSAAARGLGLSGAALKGAAAYTTGLSDNTYNQRFNQAQTQWGDQVANRDSAFNKLYAVTGIGRDSAAALAGQAGSTGAGIAKTQLDSGAATAAGINAAGQASAAGITGATSGFNNALSQYMYSGKSMYGSPVNPSSYNANGYQGWWGV